MKKQHEVMMNKLKAIRSVRSIPNIPHEDCLPGISHQDELSYEQNSISIMMENELNGDIDKISQDDQNQVKLKSMKSIDIEN